MVGYQHNDAGTLLEVRDLRTHFMTRRGLVQAVNGVNFELEQGETLGLVGESGSGKTITCLSILRLLPRGGQIVGGEIIFDGQDIVKSSEDEMRNLRGKRVGMILQNSMAALDPVFSIGTQVAEPLVVHQGLPWKRAVAGSIELLRMVKINDPEVRVRNYPHELSGGMRQRASSAASIGPHPDLLIADEPTTALDVTTQRQYLDLLKELQKATGMAIIFITHDISIVGNLCDKLAVFYGGLVVEYGPKDQVLNNPSHPYTKALLQALPTLGQKRDRLQTIPGEPPHAGNLPPACPFHPRCEQAMDTCKQGDPPPEFYLGNGHQARCWLLEKDYEQYSH
ncbi:MAG: ABC transporter ATP-binding protein [Chloroflexota bacterium]|nr:ABC transporter ATP-binding protein [Chloroflexota bacterium]MED5569360.1 ABC transporter ATP-binding protein [Chloroflexota bacterium]